MSVSLKKKIMVLVDLLKRARVLIVEHHNCSRQVKLGQICPVCSEDKHDVTLNEIAIAIGE